jgi:hypothetical protein
MIGPRHPHAPTEARALTLWLLTEGAPALDAAPRRHFDTYGVHWLSDQEQYAVDRTTREMYAALETPDGGYWTPAQRQQLIDDVADLRRALAGSMAARQRLDQEAQTPRPAAQPPAQEANGGGAKVRRPEPPTRPRPLQGAQMPELVDTL